MAFQIFSEEQKPVSEINVTPLVDVMLVLLIIFMVTAPLLETGMNVSLPKTSAKSLNASEEAIVLTLNKEREIYISKELVSQKDLKKKLESFFSRRNKKEIVLKADETLPYGFVADVMSTIKSAGIEKIGLVTEPR